MSWAVIRMSRCGRGRVVQLFLSGLNILVVRGWRSWRRRNSRTRAIIGAVIGGVILLCLIAFIVLAKRRRRRMMQHSIATGGPLPPRGRFGGFGPQMFMRGGNDPQQHHGPPMHQNQSSFPGYQPQSGYGGQPNSQTQNQNYISGENQYSQYQPPPGPPPTYHKDVEAGEKQLNNPAPPPAAHTNNGPRHGENGFVGGFRNLN